MSRAQGNQGQYNPRFSYTDGIVNNLMTIEGACRAVEFLHLPPDAAFLMKYDAQRRSTRASTAIEGNTLDDEAIRGGIAAGDRSVSEQEQEVRNYWRALDWVEQQVEANARFSEEFIRRLHRIIIVRGRGRRGEMSEYRAGECPVTDATTGEVSYAPPEPGDVPALMSALVAWYGSREAAALPGPVRAGILSYQFVAIHPFDDGNGRTARALATADLWRSEYQMRGFLSVEEYYFQDLAGYYAALEMGLASDYYQREKNYDITGWLEYFVWTLATAAQGVRDRAMGLRDARREASLERDLPWEGLSRRQQQLLMRLVLADPEAGASPTFTASDIAEWFTIGRSAAYDWLAEWHEGGDGEPFVVPAAGTRRITSWRLNEEFAQLVAGVRTAIRRREQHGGNSAVGKGR